MPALKSSRISVRLNNNISLESPIVSSRNNSPNIIYQSIPVSCRSPINRTPLCEHFTNINQKVNSQLLNNSHPIIKLRVMATSGMGLIPMSAEILKCFVEKELLTSRTKQESDLGRPLILDCRPFLVHTDSHIMESISVHCPAILRSVQ